LINLLRTSSCTNLLILIRNVEREIAGPTVFVDIMFKGGAV